MAEKGEKRPLSEMEKNEQPAKKQKTTETPQSSATNPSQIHLPQLQSVLLYKFDKIAGKSDGECKFYHRIQSNLKYQTRIPNENGEFQWKNRGYYRIPDVKKCANSRSLRPGQKLHQYIPYELEEERKWGKVRREPATIQKETMIQTDEIDFAAHFASLNVKPEAAAYLANRLKNKNEGEMRELEACWTEILEEKMTQKKNEENKILAKNNLSRIIKCEPKEAEPKVDEKAEIKDVKCVGAEMRGRGKSVGADEAREMRGWLTSVITERQHMKDICYENSQWDFITDPAGTAKKEKEKYLNAKGHVTKKISFDKIQDTISELTRLIREEERNIRFKQHDIEMLIENDN